LPIFAISSAAWADFNFADTSIDAAVDAPPTSLHLVITKLSPGSLRQDCWYLSPSFV
jgi:hypothetical protein